MKRVDALVLKELSGPWIFGVGMFSALLMAATYLNRLADYIVQGVPAGKIGELTILLVPAILVQTFAMSMLLAALLSFGKLSGDSEIVAMRASGASIYRIVTPVAVFAVFVASLAFCFNEFVVPIASKRSLAIMSEIAKGKNVKTNQPTAQPITEDGRTVAWVTAQSFSLASRTLRDVTIISLDKQGALRYTLQAPELEFVNKDDWRIRGGAVLKAADGTSTANISGDVWPDQLPKLNKSIEDFNLSSIRDNSVFSMAEIREIIDNAKRDQSLTPDKIRNFEYGYWNKIALPLAAVVFGTLGAGLGIRNHRSGTAAGFALALGIIFGYFTIANFMNVWALSGAIPAYAASFTPLVIGSIISIFVMLKRNS